MHFIWLILCFSFWASFLFYFFISVTKFFQNYAKKSPIPTRKSDTLSLKVSARLKVLCSSFDWSFVSLFGQVFFGWLPFFFILVLFRSPSGRQSNFVSGELLKWQISESSSAQSDVTPRWKNGRSSMNISRKRQAIGENKGTFGQDSNFRALNYVVWFWPKRYCK